jgi:hypothetical protein
VKRSSIGSTVIGFMGWAIVLDGRNDPGAILLLFDDRQVAEEIASEVRRRGHPVVVRPYPQRPDDNEARPASSATREPNARR